MSFSIPVPSELSLPQTVTLSDSRCRVDTGENHLTGKTFLNDCGTTVSFTNDTIIFSNAIYLSFADNASDVNRVIPLECRYERVSELHLSYLPIVRRVLFTETGVGQFGFRIEQFKDDSFSAAARVADSAYPLRTTPSEAIFVQLSLEDANLGHGRFGMVVEGCVASPSSSMVAASKGTYEKLIEGGCPASSDVYLIRNHNATHDNLSRHFRFSFKAVTFLDSQGRASAGLVYIHCRVRLCPPHACPPRSRACPLPASFHVRERRAVSESGDRVVGHHQLSTGPLLVVGDSGESAAVSSASSVPLIVLGAIAASATLLAAAVLVAWRRARRGEGHRQLKVTTGLE